MKSYVISMSATKNSKCKTRSMSKCDNCQKNIKKDKIIITQSWSCCQG